MRINRRVLLVLSSLVAFATVSVTPRIVGSPAIVVVQFHITGMINGDSFTQDGDITCDMTTGIATATGVFSKIPVGFHPFVSGGSDKCHTCKWNSRELYEAINLDTATHGNFDAISYLTIKDHTGTLIGNITSGPAHIRKVSETLYTMDSEFNGYYNGPTDIINFGGYKMLLHQEASGKIIGTYTQQIFRSNGTSLTLTANTIYTYSDGEMLPFDEAKTTDFTDGTLDGLVFSFKVTSTYTPWTVGGLWVPIDKFGLLAPYIGLVSTIVAATVAAAIYVKRRRDKR